MITNSINQPFFSIIVCSLNRAYIIERALKSLLNQTFKNWECIIVDDGSEDNTFSIAKSYIDRYDNFKYIYIKRSSLGMTRNAGIIASSGKYISFLDTDDEYKPEHLELRYNELLNTDIELLEGGLEVIGNPMVPNAEKPDECIHIENCCVGGTFFIRRDVFHRIGLFADLTFADDFEFHNRAITHGIKIKKVNYPTYIYYRDSADSICNNL